MNPGRTWARLWPSCANNASNGSWTMIYVRTSNSRRRMLLRVVSREKRLEWKLVGCPAQKSDERVK